MTATEHELRFAALLHLYRVGRAELEVLQNYNAKRQVAGHDFGCGQRGAELIRRRRALRELALRLEFDHEHPESRIGDPTGAELAAAFENIGRQRLKRAENDHRLYNTSSSARTLSTWRRIERVYAGRADT